MFVCVPQEIHAACMIAYGIATSFQVLSNLSNTSEMRVPEKEKEKGEGGDDAEDDAEEARRIQEEQKYKHLFVGGRLPSKKLTVNYLMEVGE
jgi:hypothetical protein